MTIEPETLPPDPDGLPSWDDPDVRPLRRDDPGPAERTPEELDRRIREGPGVGGGPHVLPGADEPDHPM